MCDNPWYQLEFCNVLSVRWLWTRCQILQVFSIFEFVTKSTNVNAHDCVPTHVLIRTCRFWYSTTTSKNWLLSSKCVVGYWKRTVWCLQQLFPPEEFDTVAPLTTSRGLLRLATLKPSKTILSRTKLIFIYDILSSWSALKTNSA